MRRVFYLSVGSKNIHIPKLIGAFLLFAAILMLLRATINIFVAYDNLKDLDNCLDDVAAVMEDMREFAAQTEENATLAQLQYLQTLDLLRTQKEALCQAKALSLDLYIYQGQESLRDDQKWAVMIGPVAAWLFWAAILVFAILLYQTGKIVLPVEEEIRITKTERKASREKKTKKREKKE